MSQPGLGVSLRSLSQTPTAKALGQRVWIDTPNLITRSMEAADVTPDFVQWFNNDQMLQGLNLPALNFSLDGLRAFVAGFDNINNFLIGIFRKSNGELLGFYNFSVNAQHRLAMLTLGGSPHIKTARADFWESWFPLCDEMMDHRGIDKISSRVLSNNRKLLFALMGTEHFICEATLKQELLGSDGLRHDVLVMSCFKDKNLRPKKS